MSKDNNTPPHLRPTKASASRSKVESNKSEKSTKQSPRVPTQNKSKKQSVKNEGIPKKKEMLSSNISKSTKKVPEQQKENATPEQPKIVKNTNTQEVAKKLEKKEAQNESERELDDNENHTRKSKI